MNQDLDVPAAKKQYNDFMNFLEEASAAPEKASEVASKTSTPEKSVKSMKSSSYSVITGTEKSQIVSLELELEDARN